MLTTLSPCSPWTGGMAGRDLGQRPATPPSGQGARCAKRANPGCMKARGQPDSPRPHPHARPAGPAPGCLEGASPPTHPPGPASCSPGAADPRRCPQCPTEPVRPRPPRSVPSCPHARGYATCLPCPARTPEHSGTPLLRVPWHPRPRPHLLSPSQTPLGLPSALSRGIRGVRLRSSGTGSRPRPRPHRPWLQPAGPAAPELTEPGAPRAAPATAPAAAAAVTVLSRVEGPRAGAEREPPCCTVEAEAAGGASLQHAARKGTRGPAPGAPAAETA